MKCDECLKEVGLHVHIVPLKIEGYNEVVFCSEDCSMYWARRNKVI